MREFTALIISICLLLCWVTAGYFAIKRVTAATKRFIKNEIIAALLPVALSVGFYRLTVLAVIPLLKLVK